jgi:hypothetical protein
MDSKSGTSVTMRIKRRLSKPYPNPRLTLLLNGNSKNNKRKLLLVVGQKKATQMLESEWFALGGQASKHKNKHTNISQHNVELEVV